MAEAVLNELQILTLIGQIKAAGMPEPMRVERAELGRAVTLRR